MRSRGRRAVAEAKDPDIRFAFVFPERAIRPSFTVFQRRALKFLPLNVFPNSLFLPDFLVFYVMFTRRIPCLSGDSGNLRVIEFCR